MTRLEAQQIIEGRLGGRTGLATQIVNEMKQAQRELENKPFLPWFLRAADVMTTDVFTIPVPSNFLRELDDEAFLTLVGETENLALEKQPYGYLSAIPEMLVTGRPKYYSLVYDQNVSFERIELFPRPEKSYTFNRAYYGADLNLSDDTTENGWLYYAPKLLIAHAGLQVAKALRSPEAVKLFASDLIEATKDYQFADVARNMAAQSMVMGG